MDNTMTEQERYGVPVAVRLRAYIPHAWIALAAFAVYLLMFAFIAGNTACAAAELRRASDSPHNEIVLAKELNGEESFLYLKNYSVSGEKGENAVSDLLMLLPETEYGNNNIYFQGTLESGTCAVSANVAAKYGLGIGDRARIMGTNKVFEVVRLLPAQDGLDEDYLREGIVVLAHDAELLERNYMYLSFMTDGDAYRSLDTLIFVRDMKQASVRELILYAVIAVLAVIAVMTVSECALFRSGREDYKTLAFLGISAPRLFVRIAAESVLRYALPAVVVSAIFAVRYGAYTNAYYIPTACLAGVCVLLSIIYSLIVIRRVYYVKSK